MKDSRRFPRQINSLETIFDFIAGFLAANGFHPSAAFDVDLVVEELFTNMVRHNQDGQHEIEITLEAENSTLTIRLCDYDVEAFDVTSVPEPNTNLPMGKRRAGGLGLHFVKQIADTFEYDYKDRNSTVTVTKRLEN